MFIMMCQNNKLIFTRYLNAMKRGKEEVSQDKHLKSGWKNCSGKLTSPYNTAG
jgi:hypothetical protein